ncbi:MAG TPA: hypothetical protein VIY73_07135, partial [Polyangiaceae bacterium]
MTGRATVWSFLLAGVLALSVVAGCHAGTGAAAAHASRPSGGGAGVLRGGTGLVRSNVTRADYAGSAA